MNPAGKLSLQAHIALQLLGVFLLCWCSGNAAALELPKRHLTAVDGLKLPSLKFPLSITLAPAPAVMPVASASQPPPSAPVVKLAGLLQLTKAQEAQQDRLADSSSSSSSNEGGTTSSDGGLASKAVSVGMAVNGGKAFARAVAHVQQPATGGAAAALANATAVADHASRTVAVSHSDAHNIRHTGTAVAETSAEALADHMSSATADSASLSVGLGGSSTSAGTSTRAAATDGSRSKAAGTAVSSAVQHGSSAHVLSDSTAAAQQHSTALTRADSITVAVDHSAAVGSATSAADARQRSTAASHSLMESFSVFNGSNTNANSLATAHTSKGGVSYSRDKAVGIGLWSSTAATNTTTQVVSTKLGLAVVTSVVRSITAQGRLACADAIRRAAAEVSTGPLMDINDVTLHLGGKAPQKCLTSYKDLALQSLLKHLQPQAVRQRYEQQQEPQPVLQTFEQLRGQIHAGMAPALQSAEAVSQAKLRALGHNMA